MKSKNLNRPKISSLKKSIVEPKMDFHSNFLFENYRWRIFGRRCFYRPPAETFTDFLGYFVIHIFGETWENQQAQKQKKEQHVVYKWFQDCLEAKINGCPDQRLEEDGNVSFIPSGPILSWLSFGYDLLCLFHKNVLPKKLIERLKNHSEFQGAWFEIAIAASLLRVGCDIKWLKDTSRRNCELIATHRTTNIQFAVEAKSRRRPGVLNHAGFEGSKNNNCAGLVQDGLGQATASMPFVLFVDTNTQFVPNIPPMEKPVLNETKLIIENLHETSASNPDKFSLLIATSFGFHYGDADKPAVPHEHCYVLPQHTRHPLPKSILDDINLSIRRYGYVPEEI